MWGAPSPDSRESQDPIVLSVYPGARALQLPGGICFLLLTELQQWPESSSCPVGTLEAWAPASPTCHGPYLGV